MCSHCDLLYVKVFVSRAMKSNKALCNVQWSKLLMKEGTEEREQLNQYIDSR